MSKKAKPVPRKRAHNALAKILKTAPNGYLTLTDAINRTVAKFFGPQYAMPVEVYGDVDAKGNVTKVRHISHPGGLTFEDFHCAQISAKTILRVLALQTGAVTAAQGDNLESVSSTYWQCGAASSTLENDMIDGAPVYLHADEFKTWLAKIDYKRVSKADFEAELAIERAKAESAASEGGRSAPRPKLEAARKALDALYPEEQTLTLEMRNGVKAWLADPENGSPVKNVSDRTIQNAFAEIRKQQKPSAK